MFASHLAMIGFNETPNKKAKFWQSYVRSLKGSEDIRAHERPEHDWDRWSRRPYSIYYDDIANPSHRITVPGYRYLPVHRETYGYSPRPIYEHHYASGRRLRPELQKARNIAAVERAYSDHLDRMKEIERRYPSRYGLYLKDRPYSLLPQDVEYEPETKPVF